ncbi:hypothetical protein BYT27DRAFT_7254706, partial [Phlegmacium glaucopus]
RAEIPETQAVIVSQSKREQKRPAAPPESSNASLGITYPLNDHPDEHLEYEDKVPKRVNDTSVEETPDDLTEYEDNVGYGVRSKVRVRIWEPAKVERLKTDFVKMANELKTVSQERASLQQTVNDMSKQLDESIQVHEAMKRELEEIERRAKQELEEVKRRAKEDLDLEQWEENDVALELARQEIKHAVDERIKAERAHDAAIQDALAAQEEARRAKILVGMHEQAVSEQVAKHKVEVDQRIKGLQESHEKQLNELRKSNEESMQEVLERYRPVLREEIFKGLGVESEAAMKEAIQQNSRRVAEAEQAQQELQQRVKDREKRLEIEVQNVKLLEEQLRCLGNDQPPTNPSPIQVDTDSGPSQKALGKRPDRPETDACARQAVKAIHKRNTRVRTETPDHEMWHQESETIKVPQRFRKPIGCTSTIANRLRIQSPSPASSIPRLGLSDERLRESTPNGRRESPTLRLSGKHGSASGPGPSTTHRDISPLVNPPVVYGSTLDQGPSITHRRYTSPPVNPPGVYGPAHNLGPSTRDMMSPLVNPPGDYDISEIQPTAPGYSIPYSSSQPSDNVPTSLSVAFQAFRDEMQEMRNMLGQLVQSRESSAIPGRMRHEHGDYKLNKSQRPRTNSRNELMKAVRDEMNKLLNIKRDTEIVDTAKQGIFADLDEAGKFEEGIIDAPPLEPLRACWDNIKCLWNFHLADIFADHLVRLKPEYNTEEKHQEIASHFMKRLEALRKELAKHIPKSGDSGEESDDQVEAHYQSRHLKDLRRKRIQKRQAGLCSIRLQICQAGSADGRNPAWEILALMVHRLGVDGNSSDETDAGDGSYAVRVKEWRSSQVKRLLRFIDNNRTQTNAYGNNKPGNPPRKRIRRTYPPVSTDRPIACLPLNFYDKTWYDSLSPLQQAQLDPQPEMELPIIDD